MVSPKSCKSQAISVQPSDEKTTNEQKIMGRMTLHKGSGLKIKSGLETQGNRITCLFFFPTLNKFILCGFTFLFFILHQDCLALLGKYELLGLCMGVSQ